MNELNDGGDESRLEVYYSLGCLRDTKDEVLNKVGNAAVGDDKQPCDGARDALGEIVTLCATVVVAAFDRSASVSWWRTRRWSGHQLQTYPLMSQHILRVLK